MLPNMTIITKTAEEKHKRIKMTDWNQTANLAIQTRDAHFSWTFRIITTFLVPNFRYILFDIRFMQALVSYTNLPTDTSMQKMTYLDKSIIVAHSALCYPK